MAHKATLRSVLIKALAHRKSGNDMMDAVLELQVTLNALIALLEANKADITGVDFAALEIDTIE